MTPLQRLEAAIEKAPYVSPSTAGFVLAEVAQAVRDALVNGPNHDPDAQPATPQNTGG